MLELIICVNVVVALFSVFMLFRGEWVYREWLKLMDNDDSRAYITWPYGKMLFHFWILDINKMINKGNK